MFNGLWTTLRSIFTRPVTIQYPEQKRPVRARQAGQMAGLPTTPR